MKIIGYYVGLLLLSFVFAVFDWDWLSKACVWIFSISVVIGLIMLMSKGYSMKQKEIIKGALTELDEEKIKK